jgi:predicted phosphate transport protein (TIGR00153 family)
MKEAKFSKMSFIPKEEKFYDLFDELAGRIEAGGKLFLEMVESGDYSETRSVRLKEIEHEADIITHRTYEKMHTTFLMPLDREDIYALVNKMDSILDMTEAAAARIVLYRVKEPSQTVVDQARILNEAIGKVKEIVHGLRNMKNAPQILQACVEVNTLENAGDVIQRRTVARLFDSEPDTRELIKWKEIHERIEEAIDVCEDVSNIAEGIVLKNG